jgi:hypothetical protein
MVIEGIRKEELAGVNVKDAVDMLYGLLESAVFRLVVLKRESISDLKQAVSLTVNRLASV